MRRSLALALGVSLVAACGGGAGAGVGKSTPEVTERPLELELRDADDALLFVGDLRGKRVLLFLFATFDGVSQAALRPLERFVRHHGEKAHVVAVAAQPDAAMLVDAYRHALSPPFPITYDPRERIAEGTSPLGAVDAIPTYVMLDARGYEVARHTGFASERKLRRMLDEALASAPIREPEKTPLLAE